VSGNDGDYLIRLNEKHERVLIVKDSEAKDKIRMYTMKPDGAGKCVLALGYMCLLFWTTSRSFSCCVGTRLCGPCQEACQLRIQLLFAPVFASHLESSGLLFPW
jgi:hypothetical protein